MLWGVTFIQNCPSGMNILYFPRSHLPSVQQNIVGLPCTPELHVSRLCSKKLPTIQFSFLCILSGTLIKFIRLGTAVINLLDKLKRFRTELNFLQSQKTDILLINVFLCICKQGASDLSWTLQPDAFFYLFLIHSVFVYLEAIKFVGTLILAISEESL